MSLFAFISKHVRCVRRHLELPVRCAKDSNLLTLEEYVECYGQRRGSWEWSEQSAALFPAEIRVVSEEGTIWRKDGLVLLADFARR